MNIQGFLSPAHFIRTCLENEYAFSVQYTTGVEVRIAHCKGTWTLLRLKNGSPTGWFAYSDSGNVDEASDEFVKAFVESTFQSSDKRDFNCGTYHRFTDAFKLFQVFRIMGGKDEEVEWINVVQPGRNALLNKETGEFELRPSIEEFRK